MLTSQTGFPNFLSISHHVGHRALKSTTNYILCRSVPVSSQLSGTKKPCSASLGLTSVHSRDEAPPPGPQTSLRGLFRAPCRKGGGRSSGQPPIHLPSLLLSGAPLNPPFLPRNHRRFRDFLWAEHWEPYIGSTSSPSPNHLSALLGLATLHTAAPGTSPSSGPHAPCHQTNRALVSFPAGHKATRLALGRKSPSPPIPVARADAATASHLGRLCHTASDGSAPSSLCMEPRVLGQEWGQRETVTGKASPHHMPHVTTLTFLLCTHNPGGQLVQAGRLPLSRPQSMLLWVQPRAGKLMFSPQQSHTQHPLPQWHGVGIRKQTSPGEIPLL